MFMAEHFVDYFVIGNLGKLVEWVWMLQLCSCCSPDTARTRDKWRGACSIWLTERAFNSSSMVCCIIILKISNIKEWIQCSNESCIFDWVSWSIWISVFDMNIQSCFLAPQVLRVTMLQWRQLDIGQWSMQLILERASWARQGARF